MNEVSANGRIKLRDSVAYNLLRRVFAIYFLFAVSITGYHMYLDYNTAQQHIVEQLGLIEKAFEDSLSTALFDLDAKQLASLLQGLRDMHAIIGVELRASNPNIFIPDASIGVIADLNGVGLIEVDEQGTRTPVEMTFGTLLTHEFVLYQPGTEIEIARGSFYSSSEIVFATVENSFVRLVVSAIAKTLLLWVLFLWAATGRLSRPLRQFAERVAGLDPRAETPEQIVTPRYHKRQDEIQVLTNAFNQMQIQLHGYVTSLREEKQNAERARAQADEANQAKSMFLSRMSHELRTPLNAIIGMSELQLAKTEPGSADHTRLTHIQEAGAHLLSLVEDVLGIVAPSDQADTLVACELDHLVDDVLEQSAAACVSNGVHIEHRTSGLRVLADKAKLRKVLEQLVSNAILYNKPKGEVLVTASELDRERVAVRVQDTGVGIEPCDQEKIFEAFSRLRHAEVNRIPGTGMGLLIARVLIEAMGGELNVRSEPNAGSEFVVSLNRA